MNKGLKVFITYAHKSSEAKDKLIIYLAVMKQNGLIDVWHDNEILPGDKWRNAIFNNLADSDILLYLTCRYSLASENCNKELTAALNPNIRVIPIILEHCDWQNHQLSEFQALPDKGKPINEWQPESKGWQNVVDGIRKAVEQMQSTSKSFPNITPEEIEILTYWTIQKGNFLMMLKQIDKALVIYSRAIELNPKNAKAYSDRGVAYGEKGNHKLALKDFKKAIQLHPNDAEVYYNRGVAYDMNSDVDHAFKDYTEAIRLNPDLAKAYTNRGNAYNNKGRLNSAIKDLNKAIQLDPNDAKAYTNRGKSYGKKGQYDQAIKDFKKAIQLDPNLAEAHNNLGLAHLKKNEVALAIKNFDKAIQLNPDYANAYCNRLGTWIYLREWEKVRTDLTAARDMKGNIIATLHDNFGSVAEFEEKTGIQLPEDIAELLTPS